jgi:hypothetical protein
MRKQVLNTLYVSFLLALTLSLPCAADDYAVDTVTIGATEITVAYSITLSPQSSGSNPTFVLEHWRNAQLLSTLYNSTESLIVVTACSQCVSSCAATTPQITLNGNSIYGNCSVKSICSANPTKKDCDAGFTRTLGNTSPILDRGDIIKATITGSGDSNSTNDSKSVTIP